MGLTVVQTEAQGDVHIKESGSEAALKIHIHNLRLKLEDDTNQPRDIETIFGVGYRLIEAAE